jgi:hypothetical protein
MQYETTNEYLGRIAVQLAKNDAAIKEAANEIYRALWAIQPTCEHEGCNDYATHTAYAGEDGGMIDFALTCAAHAVSVDGCPALENKRMAASARALKAWEAICRTA